jgi:COP9 signalosome complex subunit 8
MLWKRIPEPVKLAEEELNAVWRIGQKMWQRDFYLMHIALAQTENWSEPVAPIMDALKGHNFTNQLYKHCLSHHLTRVK